MASASSNAKGWLLPVATATYGYALTKSKPAVALLGIAAALIFTSLDAHYLRQERAFRALYRAAAEGRVEPYEMNTHVYYGKPNGDASDVRQENCRRTKVLWSWSLAGFYVPVVLLGLVVTAAACR